MGKTVIKAEKTLLYTGSVDYGVGEVTLIDMDLSEFTYLEIWYNSRNGRQYGFKSFRTEIPNDSTDVGMIIAEASRNVLVERSFYINNHRLRTGSGYYYNTYAGSVVNNNNFIIPYKVFGIR